jgi:hypothetical protein
MRNAVVESPAVPYRRLNDVERLLRVKTRSSGETHRLSCRSDMTANQQLIDHLNVASCSQATRNMVEFFRHIFEDWICEPQSIIVTRSQYSERPFRRSRSAS